eukprot:jgi/Mesen1/3889/ME000208S02899
MPNGGITSSADTVGVAVVNYKVPVVESKEEILANCERIAEKVAGAKRGYPGLDLIIFPEYSTQGFHPTKWRDFTTTLHGPEVAIFSVACRESRVWGVFSLTGEQHPEAGRNPLNTLVLIDDRGTVAYTYHKMFPWDPQEPWTAGRSTGVVQGPKGIILGGVICYDAAFPEVCRDGSMYPAVEQCQLITRARAAENNVYVAMSNLAGSDKTYSYWGGSMIVDFDGTVIAQAAASEDAITYATLSLTTIRDARRSWTGENHLYNLLHRGYSAVPGGSSECPFEFYKSWVTEPEVAKRNVELLTRDADDPGDSTERVAIAPPPPSLLWQQSSGRAIPEATS